MARAVGGGKPPLWYVRSADRLHYQSGGSRPTTALATALLDLVRAEELEWQHRAR